MIQCPYCRGRRTVTLLVHSSLPGMSGPREGVCSLCSGTGSISEEQSSWVEIGRQMRDERVNGKPYRSLHEEARQRGISMYTLSQMESGRIRPVRASREEQA